QQGAKPRHERRAEPCAGPRLRQEGFGERRGHHRKRSSRRCSGDLVAGSSAAAADDVAAPTAASAPVSGPSDLPVRGFGGGGDMRSATAFMNLASSPPANATAPSETPRRRSSSQSASALAKSDRT